MKNLILKIKAFSLAFMLMFISMSLCAQGGVSVDETNWPVIIILIVIAGAEIILRAIPGAKWTGVLGLVINLLKFLSDWLNNKEEN
ncbi:MAG: hypothetical protein IIC75_03280 [Bacteroidetes bacterium]|nr:hypothetical protein [Bacteroidota bacterium]